MEPYATSHDGSAEELLLKGKAEDEQAAAAASSAAETASAMAAAAHAAERAFAMAATAMVMAYKASDEAAAKQLAAIDAMTSMEYLTAYKELHPREVHLIMRFPVVRTPFADSYTYKSLVADNPDATQEELDAAAEEYQEELDRRTRFHDYVRSEYQAKGYVRVGDAYIARRVEVEEFSRKLMEGLSSDGSDSDDDGAEEEEAAH